MVAHFQNQLFLKMSFCVHVFSKMIELRTKIKILLFSVLIEVTEYVAVFKNINFFKNSSYFYKNYIFLLKKLPQQIVIAKRVFNISQKSYVLCILMYKKRSYYNFK